MASRIDCQGRAIVTYVCCVCREERDSFDDRASLHADRPVCITCARDSGYSPSLYE